MSNGFDSDLDCSSVDRDLVQNCSVWLSVQITKAAASKERIKIIILFL